ncbi:hypothetical protein PHET_03820 [Paragonimus heterotremus]|uniref:Uncharacterized protein n=1 Tax=Paragonimus heterotremus TaxID=100268 RepID=A0A8J4TH21_9TREM|nr:hypothetical protein PHET_03820 [Paragonimus heterotremus]
MKLTVCIFILVWCVCSVHMRSFSYHPIYQNDGMPTVYKMPKRHSMQLKVFIECRRDCSNKCNHSLFAFLSHENECFTCLLECMSAFTQQAEKVGIQLNQGKRGRGSSDNEKLSDSLYAPSQHGRRRRLRHNVYGSDHTKTNDAELHA